jgi:hypothetical protein
MKLDDRSGASLGSSREHCFFRRPFRPAAIGLSSRSGASLKELVSAAN